MRIALVSPALTSGGKLTSQKLSRVLDAEMISAELPLNRIRLEVVKKRFEIVDIQLEYRTFGSHLRTLTSLPVLVLLLRRAATVYVSVHGVLTYESMQGQHLRFFKWLAYVASLRLAGLLGCRMLAHTDEMKSELAGYGFRDVIVIPHGSGPLSYQKQDASRTGVLFFGFIRPSKGIEKLILAFKQVVQTYPNSLLIIAGGVTNSRETPYLNELLELVRQLQLQQNVRFRLGFLGESDMKSLAAESGVLVLPYLDNHVEVSGVVHDFAGYGMAVLCSETPRFEELRDGFDCLKTKSTPTDLAESICRLLGSIELREGLARNLSRLAKDESWEAVARMRLEVYAHERHRHAQR